MSPSSRRSAHLTSLLAFWMTCRRSAWQSWICYGARHKFIRARQSVPHSKHVTNMLDMYAKSCHKEVSSYRLRSLVILSRLLSVLLMMFVIAKSLSAQLGPVLCLPGWHWQARMAPAVTVTAGPVNLSCSNTSLLQPHYRRTLEGAE